jgi:hypothetical protein
MKILFLAALLLMPPLSLRPMRELNESQSTQQTEQELRKLTTKIDNALVAKDFDSLKDVLSDHYTMVGLPREDYFNLLKSYDSNYEFIRRDIVRVSFYDDMAVVAGGLMQRGGSRGVTPYNSEFSFADVWARLHGRWQCVSTWLGDASEKKGFRAAPELKASAVIFFKTGATDEEIERLFANIQLVLRLRRRLVKKIEPEVCDALRVYPPLQNHERIAVTFCPATDEADRKAITEAIKASTSVYKVLQNVSPIEVTKID